VPLGPAYKAGLAEHVSVERGYRGMPVSPFSF
jgi:hypothetical protein